MEKMFDWVTNIIKQDGLSQEQIRGQLKLHQDYVRDYKNDNLEQEDKIDTLRKMYALLDKNITHFCKYLMDLQFKGIGWNERHTPH